MNETEYLTNAIALFSDNELHRSLFPFANVECARFKSIKTEEFIDQKSILSNIATQAEEAYNFALRHINKGAVVKVFIQFHVGNILSKQSEKQLEMPLCIGIIHSPEKM